jgi:hypothetical protein
MKYLGINLILGSLLLLDGSFMLARAQSSSVAGHGGIPRAFSTREIISRGAIRDDIQRVKERLKQLRTQEERMPRDIRDMSPLPMGKPGESRPEASDYLSRDRSRFVAGGWLWNENAIPLYTGASTPVGNVTITGPSKGSSFPIANLAEHSATDPEGSTIQREEPLIEWWESNEQSTQRRADFYRSKFGASQKVQSMPSVGSEIREFSQPPAGGM